MKPDRFKRAVERVQERWRGTSTGTRHLVPSHKAITLLRRQFAQMRRVVVTQRWKRAAGVNAVGYFAALDDVVKKLDAYKRGTK